MAVDDPSAMSVPRLSDGRVVLRALREDDINDYLAAFDEGDCLLNLLGFEEPPSRDRIERWLEHNWVEPPEMRSWEFVVADAESDEFVGTTMIHSCDWKNRRAEIGIGMVSDKRAQGHGSAALRLLLDWAFEDLGIERMEMTTLPENLSVPRLADKFGFTYEGTLRERNFERGRRVDLLIWGLLKDEWIEARA